MDDGAGAGDPKRILVVDDERDVRQLLGDFFRSEGYLVTEAPDASRGLDELRDVCPDVVILDLMMPVMNGWGFVEECRRMNGRDVPIIVISAMFDLETQTNALQSMGVRECIAKPFDLEVMLSLVAKLV